MVARKPVSSDRRGRGGVRFSVGNRRAGGVKQSCPPRGGLVIAINSGDIDCASAYVYAGQYNQSGDKYQTIGPFTCYFGNSFTAPMLFTCVSNEPAAQFSVFPA